MSWNTYAAEEAALLAVRDIESDESGDDESEEEEVEIQPPTNPNNDLSMTEYESSQDEMGSAIHSEN